MIPILARAREAVCPLPMHQVRLQPGTGYAWQKYPQGWRCPLLTTRRTDDQVRSWPIMRAIPTREESV